MIIFLLFAGDDYYPAGGWNDFLGEYDSLATAIDAAARMRTKDWAHIVQISDSPATIVWSTER